MLDSACLAGNGAALLKLIETPARSWFLALYLPDAYQWPMIAAMFAIGLALLVVGLRLTSTDNGPVTGAARGYLRAPAARVA